MKINGHDFLVGADPEVFVKRNGVHVSAHGLIPGTKENPYKVVNGAVQVDGMALEFNISPASDYDQWERNLTSVLEQLTDMVPGYEIFIESVAEFGNDYIQAQPKIAKQLGCEPDFNAWTNTFNPTPQASMPFRTASGHVHIGWHKEPVDPNDPGHMEACKSLAKMLDVFIGIPSLLWDKDSKRRTLYGKAGSFRPKPYGMEYRVLSNKWLDRALLRKFVYHNSLKAVEMCFANENFYNEVLSGGVSVQDFINNYDDFTKEMVDIITIDGRESKVTKAFYMIQEMFANKSEIPTIQSYK
jgi:hypothetical protein